MTRKTETFANNTFNRFCEKLQRKKKLQSETYVPCLCVSAVPVHLLFLILCLRDSVIRKRHKSKNSNREKQSIVSENLVLRQCIQTPPFSPFRHRYIHLGGFLCPEHKAGCARVYLLTPLYQFIKY